MSKENIGRQLFFDADLHQYKSAVLASRFGHALGIPIEAFVGPVGDYNPKSIGRNTLVVLVGCVDKPAGRRQLSELLERNPYGAAQVVWLDCGNLRDSGKVYFGTRNRLQHLQGSFPLPKVCTELPSAAMLQPRLLEEEDAADEDAGLNCAQLINLRHQSLMVNKMAATIAGGYLTQLLLEGSLRTFATYFNLKPFGMRSEPIHPDVVARLTGAQAEFLERQKKEETTLAA